MYHSNWRPLYLVCLPFFCHKLYLKCVANLLQKLCTKVDRPGTGPCMASSSLAILGNLHQELKWARVENVMFILAVNPNQPVIAQNTQLTTKYVGNWMYPLKHQVGAFNVNSWSCGIVTSRRLYISTKKWLRHNRRDNLKENKLREINKFPQPRVGMYSEAIYYIKLHLLLLYQSAIQHYFVFLMIMQSQSKPVLPPQSRIV